MHYARVPRLFADLELAHGDGRFARLFRTLTKADLLILDDWGPDRLSANQRRDLMEIVEDRYGAGSTLITSQLPVDAWHEAPTLSSTASCITPIVLRSMGHRCAIPRRPSRIPQRRGRARRIGRSQNRRQERKNEQCALRPAHARRCV
ncbi:DNA replication protein DnaC [Bradyrhizobium sp. LM2.7]